MDPSSKQPSEIQLRQRLLGFTTGDAELLLACRALAEQALAAVIDGLCAQSREAGERLPSRRSADPRLRWRQRLARHCRELFSGSYDSQYAGQRLRLSRAYRRAGVAPGQYLATLRASKSLLMAAIAPQLGTRAEATREALEKLLCLDAEFCIDSHVAGLRAALALARERARELEKLARKDGLTGLSNQGHFVEILNRELARCTRKRLPLTLLYLDLDDFKAINDSAGHSAGDAALRRFAQLLVSQCRQYDLACRLGGDEFCVLLPETDAAGGREFAQRLHGQLAQGAYRHGLSIGIAQAGPAHWPSALALLDTADRAMYAAKRQGGARAHVAG